MMCGKNAIAAATLIAGTVLLLCSQTIAETPAQQTNVEIPVRFEGVQNTYVDDEPVNVALHEYIRGTDTVTGRSISFSFPRSFYTWAENARGGAQYRIALAVQAETFEPILKLQQEVRDNTTLTPDQRKQALGELLAQNLGITIYSPTKSVNVVAGAAYAFQEYKKGRRTPIGRLCGLAIFRDRRTSAESSDAGPETLLHRADATVLAFSTGAISFDDLTVARCTAHSPICIVQTPYVDWRMSFHVKRGDLCSWERTAVSIRGFLDAHVISQTQRTVDPKQ